EPLPGQRRQRVVPGHAGQHAGIGRSGAGHRRLAGRHQLLVERRAGGTGPVRGRGRRLQRGQQQRRCGGAAGAGHRRSGLAMALIAVAADKGAPGVTTACLALTLVWPRAVLLAECDPAGGDLIYRLPGARGGQLDPGRGLLSLAVAARRGPPPRPVLEPAQPLRGGLDVRVGVVTAEQGTGLEPLWGPVGAVLARLPDCDVIADCGRIGADGPHYDLLAYASSVVLVTRASLEEVVRLRERVAAVISALGLRHRQGIPGGGMGGAGPRRVHPALTEAGQALGPGGASRILGGLAYEPKAAEALGGVQRGHLGRSLLLRTARGLAGRLARSLAPDVAAPAGRG